MLPSIASKAVQMNDFSQSALCSCTAEEALTVCQSCDIIGGGEGRGEVELYAGLEF